MNSNIVRRRTGRGVEVKNPETGRFVIETGRVGKSVVTDPQAVGTLYGNVGVKAKAPYRKIAPRQNKGWTTIVNKREIPTTLSKMVNTVLAERKPGRSDLYVDFLFRDWDGDKRFRSVKLAGHTKESLFNHLTDMRSVNSGYGGSDVVEDGFEIQTTFFAVKFNSRGGGNARDRYTINKTEFFKVQDYKCAEGDCLLAILRNTKVPYEKIRQAIGLKKGLIKLIDIPKVEDYFKVNITIFHDSINIVKRVCEDTAERNRTKVVWDYEYQYKSEGRYDEDYDILLKNEHYSLITKKREVQFDRVCGDRLRRIEDRDTVVHKLTKAQREKSLIRQDRVISNKPEVIIKNVKYLFFDIETIFDPTYHNYLAPYSVAWWVADALNNPVKFTPKNIEKYVTETQMLIGNDCMEKFVDWIEDNQKETRYILIGFNNSRFDNFPLLNQVIENDIFGHMLFVQNSILKLDFGNGHTTFDLCRFVMSSLKVACKSFNVYPPKMDGFSHFAPQDAFAAKGWEGLFEWTAENEELLTRYNKLDVLATANLFFIVRQAYAKMTNADILKYTTLASLSFDCFKNSISSTEKGKRVWKYDISAPPTHELDKFARKGAIGGRCQNFNRYARHIDRHTRRRRHVNCVDVKSLYPYIMLNRHFPCGEMKYTKKFRKDKLGMYRVWIRKQPAVKIIPQRGEETLDWEYTGITDAIITSVEIDCLERHGAEYEILPLHDGSGNVGVYWEEYSDNIFKDFFEEIKNEKTRQDEYARDKSPLYNPALRNICKLLLNSLSGKPLQRNFDTTIEMVKNEKEQEKFNKKVVKDHTELLLLFSNCVLLHGKIQEEKIYDAKKAKPSYLGVFIYAHARTYMYDLLFSNYDVIYTDTDSGVLTRPDYDDFAKKKIKKYGKAPHNYYGLADDGIDTIGGDFGQFEEEFDSHGKDCESYFIAKKVYAVEIRDKDGNLTPHSKYRMKGVNLGLNGQATWDCLISKDEAEVIDTLEPSLESNQHLYELFKTHLKDKRDPMEPFRRLSEDGECYFFCSKLMKKNLHIAQSFSIKRISAGEL